MTSRPSLSIVVLAALLIQISSIGAAVASEFESDPDWKISAYLWSTGLSGEMGIGPITADVDLSFSDLVSALDIGGSAIARRDWGANALIGDLSYFALSPDDAPGPLGTTISPNLKMPLLSAYYARKWGTESQYGGIMVGARYMKMDLTLKVKGLPGDADIKKSGSPSFTDFLVGGMYSRQLSDRWNMMLQGDVGVGGSNNSWNLQAIFQRKTKSGNMWNLGARILSIDFDDTLPGGTLFVVDAEMAGLMLGFTWD